MTRFHLATRIEDRKRIRCTLTSTDDSLDDPTLCFSLQAPARIVTGGTKIEGLGGFTAVRLTGRLTPDTPIEFCLGFEDPQFLIGNRAWHPQGPYIRLPDGTAPVAMDLPLGVPASEPPAPEPPANGLALIPAPVAWSQTGDPIPATGFSITGDFPDAVAGAQALADRLGVSSFASGPTALRIAVNSDLPPEGYDLSIALSGLTLSAADRSGAFYGLISLLSLSLTHGQLPQGTITDHPRFEWRGFMLDCVREFYPVSTITRLMDLMAMLKLNRFHWHFADDEAFRLEVETAPDLWQGSAFRGEGQPIPGVFGGRPGPTGGSYSKADVQTVLDHAASLSIEVLPEIEVPAHALALTTLRPELRDPDDTGTEASVQGYPRNVMNPALDATWDLLEPLAQEVADLFPIGMIHLGGDELPDNTWAGSPLVDAYKATHGLHDHHDVQGHLMHRLASGLRAAGVTPCAWQEAADGCTGGIGNDAILFSWTGQGPGRDAAKAGYRVVMCPAQHCYFDMAHTADDDDWGANWAATYALDMAFEWDPIPAPEVADQIIGVQGTFWSEFTSEPGQIEAMIAPRIFGLATKGWSAGEGPDLTHLRRTATCYGPVMKALDWAVHWPAITLDTPRDYVRRVDA